jgi:FkbM family methyltransferase
MRSDLRCALIVLPGEGSDSDRLRRSLDASVAIGMGDFATVDLIPGAKSRHARDSLRAGVAAAAAAGYDWALALSATETLAPDIFVKTQPALRVHESLWGGAALAMAGGPPPKLERITRLAAQDLPTFFHAALQWWIGPAHFVRPTLAEEALRATDTSAWYADYMLNLWKRGTAYKTAQCLTHFHTPLPPVSEADRARLVMALEEEPVFMPLRYGGEVLKVPYTGLNPVIEREQMRGLFFEQEELVYLANRLPRGLRIADVGANTGNHTLFFAAVMQAENVVPVEPLPRAVAAIRAVVAENRLTNVDLSRRGCAVGAGEGLLRPVPSSTAGLGATHFVPDPAGSVPVRPLDRLLAGKVDFLKLDVEGMEMQALAGAAGLIAAQHPVLYVEVVDEGVAEFMAWVDANGYLIERLFPDKTHCNYLLVPKGRQQGFS